MSNSRARIGYLPLLGIALFAVSGCVDEKIVFKDRELFTDPPTAAASFLGYTDHDSKLTVCGNCHIGPQAQWKETPHASAWADLQANPGAAGFCEGCHTVGELGNTVTGSVGYAATGDARYEDVQCESCHAAGLTHVTNPSDATVPLPVMSVGLDLSEGCGECHQGTHHPFVEEWSQSGHGTVVAYPASRPDCEGCHTGEGALAAWGVNTVYAEQDRVAQPGEHLAITCAVCHDPHGSDNDAQLRFPVDVPSEEGNLCMKCHHKRGTPDPASFRGPHSPEGPTLLGTAGWWPPSLEFPGGKIVATHGSDANPKLCASCHVQSFTVTDEQSGDFVFQSTGHLFQATPCIGADGLPTSESCDEVDRTFQSCVTSGCHTSEDGARAIMLVAELRIDALANELSGLISQVPASEFDEDDARYTVGEGAKFNLGLAESGGAVVHNPFLIEALLIASVQTVKDKYGLAALSNVSLERELASN
jgi:predicted CXXCH cytochrome family protein